MQQLRPAAKVYLTVVTVGALAALSAAVVELVQSEMSQGAFLHPDSQLRVLVVLAPIFVLSMFLKSRMTQQVDLSANVPIFIAAYLIGGWAVACLVGVSSIVLDRRRALSRTLFNNAQWVLMGLGWWPGLRQHGRHPHEGPHSNRGSPRPAGSHHRVDRGRDRCQCRAHARNPGLPGKHATRDHLAQHGADLGRSLLRLRTARLADGGACGPSAAVSPPRSCCCRCWSPGGRSTSTPFSARHTSRRSALSCRLSRPKTTTREATASVCLEHR